MRGEVKGLCGWVCAVRTDAESARRNPCLLSEPIRLVKEGTPGATIVGVKRVNELAYYSLGLKDLAKKAGISQPKALAVIRKLDVQENDEYFKVIKIGKAEYKRYSPKALNLLKNELPDLDLDQIWKEYNPKAWRERQ